MNVGCPGSLAALGASQWHFLSFCLKNYSVSQSHLLLSAKTEHTKNPNLDEHMPVQCVHASLAFDLCRYLQQSWALWFLSLHWENLRIRSVISDLLLAPPLAGGLRETCICVSSSWARVFLGLPPSPWALPLTEIIPLWEHMCSVWLWSSLQECVFVPWGAGE